MADNYFLVGDPCPVCGNPTQIGDSALIYGTSYGPSIMCSHFPVCDTYAGHPKGQNPAHGNPTALPAGKSLRARRREFHELADVACKWDTGMTRTQVYACIREWTGLSEIMCHGSRADTPTIMRMLDAVKRLRKEAAGEMKSTVKVKRRNLPVNSILRDKRKVFSKFVEAAYSTLTRAQIYEHIYQTTGLSDFDFARPQTTLAEINTIIAAVDLLQFATVEHPH